MQGDKEAEREPEGKKRLRLDTELNRTGLPSMNTGNICINCVLGFAKRLASFLTETYPSLVTIHHVDVPNNLVFFTCVDEEGAKEQLVKSLYSHQFLLRYIVRFYFFDTVIDQEELRPVKKLKESTSDDIVNTEKEQASTQKDEGKEEKKPWAVRQKEMEEAKVLEKEEEKKILGERISSMLDRISFPEGCVVRAHMWPKALAEREICDQLVARKIVASPTAFTHVLCLVVYQDKWYWGLHTKEPYYYEKDNDTLKVDSAISRAYYKIQEACLRFKVPLNETWKVLDLGAAPGGWSQWLSQVAHIVVAVDPANMRIPTHKSAKFVPRTEPAKGTELEGQGETTNVYHAQLRFEDPQLHEELTQLGPQYDLIVCDVNFPADNAIDKLLPMVEKYLKVGGHFIMTLKLAHRKALKRDDATKKQMDEGIAHFVRKMTPMCQMPDVKFLFSNKNERTLHSIRVLDT